MPTLYFNNSARRHNLKNVLSYFSFRVHFTYFQFKFQVPAPKNDTSVPIYKSSKFSRNFSPFSLPSHHWGDENITDLSVSLGTNMFPIIMPNFRTILQKLWVQMDDLEFFYSFLI